MHPDDTLDKSTIEDICRESCPCEPGQYCELKELLIRLSPKIQHRLATQLTLIDKFKYERSTLKGDIGRDEAGKLWVNEGHAERFDRFYELYHDEKIPLKELYNLSMNRNEKGLKTLTY